MAEHSDLISEMPFLEKLNTEERLKLARKRRSQQLKKWSQRDREGCFLTKRKRPDLGSGGGGGGDAKSSLKNSGYKVHFVPSVMLLEAATRNDVDEVRRLLMLGVSPDSTNEDGLTALHQCCIDNCEEMMLLLIEFGANVNAKDSEQWTPLHAAATCGHLHLIKILIEKGADLLAVNADGNMPYDICEDELTLDYIESEMAKRGITQELIDNTRALVENQMLEDMRQLVANGYDINVKDEQGATPLHIAASNGYTSVVEFLLDNNASMDECDDDLWQPIHAAACWGHVEVIEYLVQNGADLEARTKNGETPYDICEDPDLKNRILQLKSEIESKRAISSNRLRRSQSQNTRTHSIRRTSIREKAQIAKREAIAEARIWHEKASHDDSVDVISKKEDSDLDSDTTQSYSQHQSDSPIDISKIDLKVDPDGDGFHPGSYHSSAKSYHDGTNGSKYPVGGSNSSLIKKSDNQLIDAYYPNYYDYYDGYENGTPINNNNGSNEQPAHPQSDAVKVEIRVTVNTNTGPATNLAHSNSNNNNSNNSNNNSAYYNSAGTLIDLKKQRSEKHRNSLGNVYSGDGRLGQPPVMDASNKPTSLSLNYSSTPNTVNSTAITAALTPAKHTANPLFDSPSSPSTIKKKFRGNPSELIGEEGKRGCCVIS